MEDGEEEAAEAGELLDVETAVAVVLALTGLWWVGWCKETKRMTKKGG